jgi:putative transposase
MRLKRELQMAENHESEGGLYHVLSRIVWREFIFGEEEKVYFYSLMRKYEQSFGVQIRSFSLMTNHFHILLYVPPRPTERMSDEEFFERMGLVYSTDLIDNLRKVIEGIRHDPGELNAAEDLELLVDKVKEPYLRRMWNLS